MHTPKLFRRLRAFFGGYFWLPCPLCGEMFAGYEQHGTLMTGFSDGRGVCNRCAPNGEVVNLDEWRHWKKAIICQEDQGGSK